MNNGFLATTLSLISIAGIVGTVAIIDLVRASENKPPKNNKGDSRRELVLSKKDCHDPHPSCGLVVVVCCHERTS